MGIDTDRAVCRTHLGDLLNNATDDEVRVWADRIRKADRVGAQRAQWAAHAATVAQSLTDSGRAPNSDHAALFWIRAHGVLSELRQHLQSVRGWTPEMRAHPLMRWKVSAADAVESAVDALSERQRITLFYMRHVQCHVTQMISQLDMKKGGRGKEEYKVDYMDRCVTVEEFEAVLDEEVARVGHEVLLAVEIARAVAPHFVNLRDAMAAGLFEP